MLISAKSLPGTKIYSMQSVSAIGQVSAPIIDPDKLQIVAFYIAGPNVHAANILPATSIREYSNYGFIVDSADELSEPGDIVRVDKAIELGFGLLGLKVITKKGSRLGHVTDFTIKAEDCIITSLIVKRPVFKSFIDPELTIPRSEIIEVTDTSVIIKSEESAIKKQATEFVPNFVNPFRDKSFIPSKKD